MNDSHGRHFSLSRFIALLGISVLILTWIMMRGGDIFVCIPSLVFTFGFTFFLLLGTFGKDYLNFLPDSMLTLFSTSNRPVPRYADICRFGSRYAIGVAVIGSLIAFMHMLRDMEDPSTIGLGFGQRLCPMLYALILSEVVFALLHKAYADGETHQATPPLAARTLAILLIGLGVLFACFLTMLMAINARY